MAKLDEYLKRKRIKTRNMLERGLRHNRINRHLKKIIK